MRGRETTLMGVIGLVLCATQVMGAAPLDRGHQILLEKGLQIQAMTSPYQPYNPPPDSVYWSAFANSNFSAPYMNIGEITDLPAIPSGQPWALHARDAWTVPAAHVPNLVNIQYRDEQNLADAATLANTVDQLARFRNLYPNALSYTNQWGTQLSNTQMRTYMSQAMPDLLSFDTYAFGNTSQGTSPTALYQDMQRYRTLALGGNDGTGNTPIPYGRYVQSFDHPSSQSQINLDHYTSWAFGFTLTNAFMYDRAQIDPPFNPVLFAGGGTGPSNYASPTQQYHYFAEANRVGRVLGDTLVRLLSTDIRFLRGQRRSGSSTVNNAIPSGISAWGAGADPYITGITATNIGNRNSGLRGDVLVGYFNPLLEEFDGAAYENEIYFMIVNGLMDPLLTADLRQNIRLTFNFGASGITSLQRINRTTGEVEIVPLIGDGGSLYHLDLVLEGGAGDLFKFNTGATFILPEPSSLAILGAAGILGLRRSKAGKTDMDVAI